MAAISFQKISIEDKIQIKEIADWYFDEWKIPTEKTILKLTNLPEENLPFQMALNVGGQMVATAGVYFHVGLLDHRPEFKIFSPWLALVYTSTENRNKGYGKMLCEKVQEMTKEAGVKELFLFTDSAEKLYSKLGWQVMDRFSLGKRNLVVMKLEL
ncbi:MAG: GNAT family N-acetyltransferase [Bacteroidetes bacterium]|nr:GNAT family N-acetyltransferase [Bacteroidota bacterium]